MRHIPLLLLLAACDAEFGAKADIDAEVDLDFDVDNDPEVQIDSPLDMAAVPVNTLITATGKVRDELEDLSSDSYTWTLDGAVVGTGLAPADGVVSTSFTLTSYGLHFLKLEVVDTKQNTDEVSITIDAGSEPDTDGDGVADSVDCNPTNATLYQSGSWYPDADKDSHGTAIGFQSCGPWEGFVTDPALADDCDDSREDTYPGAPEICNSHDEDCDGINDNNAIDAYTWYIDMDGDGWGNSSNQKVQCTQPYGYVAETALGVDCDDGNPARHPGAPENCDGNLDMDCDGVIAGMTWYYDADADGYGDPNNVAASNACVSPGPEWVPNSGDCNDVQNSGEQINAGAMEVCDTLDNDCDGATDDDDPSVANKTRWYWDSDADGFGNAGQWVDQCFATACAQNVASCWVTNNNDCDDRDAQMYPGAFEYCNGDDDDCDGIIDDNAIDASTWYSDADGDGYGTAGGTALSCTQPTGYAANADDCDDGDSAINPGTLWYADQDGDNFGDPSASIADCSAPTGYLSDSTDCDDNHSGIFPGALEACDAVDQDCDAAVDEEVADDSYEVAGVTPYNLGTLSSTKTVVGWFSSTDTTGEDWYTITVTTSSFPKTVRFTYSGPSGYLTTMTDNTPNAPQSYPLSSGVTTNVTIGANKTMTFTIPIIADSSLSDSDLCAIPYTLTIQ